MFSISDLEWTCKESRYDMNNIVLVTLIQNPQYVDEIAQQNP